MTSVGENIKRTEEQIRRQQVNRLVKQPATHSESQ